MFDMVPIAQYGGMAVEAAEAAWELHIVDPPNAHLSWAESRDFIDRLIRTDDGLSWEWNAPYLKNNDYQWCGAFASYCWAKAGLKVELRQRYFSSTYRLDCYGRYAAAFGESQQAPAVAPRKYLALDARLSLNKRADLVEEFAPQAGDILLTGASSYGGHVTLVVSYDPAKHVFNTIEGNARGTLPDGTEGEGVIRKTRTLAEARRLIRPSIHDLEVV